MFMFYVAYCLALASGLPCLSASATLAWLTTLMLLLKASATITDYKGHHRTLSFFLPGTISLFIMCVGIIWNNSLMKGGRARTELWTPAPEARLTPLHTKCTDHWALGRSHQWPFRKHFCLHSTTKCSALGMCCHKTNNLYSAKINTWIMAHYCPGAHTGQLLCMHSSSDVDSCYSLTRKSWQWRRP